MNFTLGEGKQWVTSPRIPVKLGSELHIGIKQNRTASSPGVVISWLEPFLMKVRQLLSIISVAKEVIKHSMVHF